MLFSITAVEAECNYEKKQFFEVVRRGRNNDRPTSIFKLNLSKIFSLNKFDYRLWLTFHRRMITCLGQREWYV